MNDTCEPPVQENPIGPIHITFREIVTEYQRSVYGLAFELTGNHHDAEDLSQEVFIKVYRSLDKFRGDSKLYSWIYRITVNTFLNKKQKKTLLFRKLTSDFSDVDPGSMSEPALETPLLLKKHLASAMQKLSKSERVAFVLRHKQDLSVKDVAKTMEVAEGTVKSLLHRALKKLRKDLHFYKEELGLQTIQSR